MKPLVQDSLERGNEGWSGLTQLLAVDAGEALQFSHALGSEADADLPPVLGIAYALHATPFRQAVDESNRAVVLDEQVVRQHADGGPGGFLDAQDGQHELVLLGLEAFFAGGSLAEVKKFPYLVPECA
jgi:hypothetical protein